MLSGIFNVLKPPGMTSHDVVNFIRKTINSKKVGHAGTLDPDAAGVLPIFVGNATRIIEYAAEADKCYRAEVTLGFKTDTGDDSGEILEKSTIKPFSQDKLIATLDKFTGDIWQVPPMYSALKHQGQKLYDLARKGQTVERTPRKVTIHNIELLSYDNEKFLFEVMCSKGTYIRTLIEDIAEQLDNYGAMSFLLRTKSSIFHLEKSSLLEDIKKQPENHLLPLEIAIEHLPKIILTDNQAKRFCQGVKTTLANDFQDDVRLYSNEGTFLGIGKTDGYLLKPHKVFCQDF